jgi:16S rRNA U1498 N3-methylase RsmE
MADLPADLNALTEAKRLHELLIAKTAEFHHLIDQGRATIASSVELIRKANRLMTQEVSHPTDQNVRRQERE